MNIVDLYGNNILKLNLTIPIKSRIFTLNAKLICNISYEKIAEILKLTNGTKIRRDILFKLTMEKAEEFLSKKELEIAKGLKTQEIEFSEVLSFDEQYIPIIG